MKMKFLLVSFFAVMASQPMYAQFGCMVQNDTIRGIQIAVCIPEGPCSGWAFSGGEQKMVLSFKNPNGLVIDIVYRVKDQEVAWKLTLPVDVANHIHQYSIGTLHVVNIFGGVVLQSHGKTYHLQAVRDLSDVFSSAAAAAA